MGVGRWRLRSRKRCARRRPGDLHDDTRGFGSTHSSDLLAEPSPTRYKLSGPRVWTGAPTAYVEHHDFDLLSPDPVPHVQLHHLPPDFFSCTPPAVCKGVCAGALALACAPLSNRCAASAFSNLSLNAALSISFSSPPLMVGTSPAALQIPHPGPSCVLTRYTPPTNATMVRPCMSTRMRSQ
jgi:hypothetical protein